MIVHQHPGFQPAAPHVVLRNLGDVVKMCKGEGRRIARTVLASASMHGFLSVRKDICTCGSAEEVFGKAAERTQIDDHNAHSRFVQMCSPLFVYVGTCCS